MVNANISVIRCDKYRHTKPHIAEKKKKKKALTQPIEEVSYNLKALSMHYAMIFALKSRASMKATLKRYDNKVNGTLFLDLLVLRWNLCFVSVFFFIILR